MAPATSSTRWCPTPEQLMILDEMYRSGNRTPSASQIQHITAHLSLYGKIEGKNVFYWFQNHKAREKLKLRRKLGNQLHQQKLHRHQHSTQPNHHFLRYFDSPASLLEQLSYYTSARFPPQVVVQSENAPQQTTNHAWNVNKPERDEMVNSLMGMCGHEWMVMVDVAPLSPCCSRPPLKTLELFPITPTNHKEECSSSI